MNDYVWNIYFVPIDLGDYYRVYMDFNRDITDFVELRKPR